MKILSFVCFLGSVSAFNVPSTPRTTVRFVELIRDLQPHGILYLQLTFQQPSKKGDATALPMVAVPDLSHDSSNFALICSGGR